MNGNLSDNIFYSNRTSVNGCSNSGVNCIVLLHGNKLGYAALNGYYQRWNVEYKTLIAQYLPPPPANSTSVIASWEIYPSTRGADIELDVKNGSSSISL